MFSWHELQLMFKDPIDDLVFKLNNFLILKKNIKSIFS